MNITLDDYSTLGQYSHYSN